MVVQWVKVYHANLGVRFEPGGFTILFISTNDLVRDKFALFFYLLVLHTDQYHKETGNINIQGEQGGPEDF